jgi:hypothetical protein
MKNELKTYDDGKEINLEKKVITLKIELDQLFIFKRAFSNPEDEGFLVVKYKDGETKYGGLSTNKYYKINEEAPRLFVRNFENSLNGRYSMQVIRNFFDTISLGIPINLDYLQFNNGCLYIKDLKHESFDNIDEFKDILKKRFNAGYYPIDSFIKSVFKFDFNINSTDKTIVDFINGLTNNPDSEIMLYTAFGDMFSNTRVLNKLPILIGKTTIGKGILLKFLRNLIGTGIVDMKIKEILSPDNFTRRKYVNMRLAIIDEFESNSKNLNIQDLKLIGRRERTEVDYKNQNDWESIEADDMPYFIAACNKLPKIPINDAIVNRLWVIQLEKETKSNDDEFERRIINNKEGRSNFIIKSLFIVNMIANGKSDHDIAYYERLSEKTLVPNTNPMQYVVNETFKDHLYPGGRIRSSVAIEMFEKKAEELYEQGEIKEKVLYEKQMFGKAMKNLGDVEYQNTTGNVGYYNGISQYVEKKLEDYN